MKRATTPTVKRVFVTPEMAKEMLKFNTMNRQISLAHVNRLAQSITNGTFIENNIGIGFDKNNVLTDGQQRLTAIIKANKGVWLTVYRNLQPEARLVVDTGRKRSHSDSLQMMGLGVETNGKKTKSYSKLLASVSAYIILHQTNQFSKIQAFGNIITNDEIVEFVKNNEDELLSSAKTVLKITKDCSYVQDTHMFFVFQMHKFFNQKRIVEFINIVCGKELSDNPDNCPATKLRSILLKNATRKFGTKFNTKDLLGLVIDASNKFMARIETKRIIGRPNGVELINVKLVGEMNDKAMTFFNSATTVLEGKI